MIYDLAELTGQVKREPAVRGRHGHQERAHHVEEATNTKQ
jgi:hypothetical protein